MNTLKLAKCLGLVFLLLGWGTPASFAGAKPKTGIDTGTVEKVNATEKTFKFADNARHPGRKITWNEHTSFKLSGVKTTAAALRPGQEIRVTYKPKGGIALALKVELSRSNQRFDHHYH